MVCTVCLGWLELPSVKACLVNRRVAGSLRLSACQLLCCQYSPSSALMSNLTGALWKDTARLPFLLTGSSPHEQECLLGAVPVSRKRVPCQRTYPYQPFFLPQSQSDDH